MTNTQSHFFNTDLVTAALGHPEFLNVGGNTGKVDTFAGVNVNNLTGGVFNAGGTGYPQEFSPQPYDATVAAKCCRWVCTGSILMPTAEED